MKIKVEYVCEENHERHEVIVDSIKIEHYYGSIFIDYIIDNQEYSDNVNEIIDVEIIKY